MSRPFKKLEAVPPTPERLSADELALLNDLRADVEQAQAVLNRFVNGVSRRRQCGPTDTLDLKTGVITRAPKVSTDG